MYKELNNTKKYFLYIVIFFVAYCAFLSWSFLFQNVDDAYISYRYGKNMMNGDGLVYNKGEYVEGYTNFLWTVITAPFTKVNAIDVSIFSSVLGLLISIANLLLLALINKQFFDFINDYFNYLLLLPTLFLALDDSIAFWAIGGMEFPLYTLFILGIIYNYYNLNKDKKHFYLMLLFLILCTLTRPEGNMIFVITLAHMILFRKNINNFKTVLVNLILYYMIFASIYYGFKFLYYGQVIPNTFYAKGVTDWKMNLLLGTKYLALCTGTRLYIFIFILFIPFKKVFSNFKISYLLLLSFIYISYLVAVGGDWMIANRFFVPILPILYILSVIGFINLLIKIKNVYNNAQKASKLANKGIVVLAVMLFSVTLGFLEYNQLIIKDNNANYELHWSMFGKWLKQNTPKETVIAVGPAGKIPYYSELYTIDMWGLNDEHIARQRSTRLQAGHKKFDFEYVLSRNPEFIIGYAGFTDQDVPSRYEKFNAPEKEYECYDIVFRLKKDYRNGAR